MKLKVVACQAKFRSSRGTCIHRNHCSGRKCQWRLTRKPFECKVHSFRSYIVDMILFSIHSLIQIIQHVSINTSVQSMIIINIHIPFLFLFYCTVLFPIAHFFFCTYDNVIQCTCYIFIFFLNSCTVLFPH